MPQQRRQRRNLLAAFAPALLAVALLAPGADAAPFGEISHTGSRGTGLGQLSVFPSETDAIGVDPSDNSVYVVDLPDEKNEFRIQKFSTNEKGEFKVVASTKFKPKDPAGGEEADTIEGVAIDPAMHRLYVLALEEREKPEQIDHFDEAASELFAFSTEQKGSELVPAPGTPTTGTEIAVLAGTKVLKPQGKNFEESLLEPTGIAVEPIDATHDNVVLVGSVDTGKKHENLNPIIHSSIWRVSSEGALLTEKRFVDTGEVLEDEATSPVVLGKKVFVETEEGVFEVPASGAPKGFTAPTEELEEYYEELKLWKAPASQFPEYGDGLTVSPEGTFWSTASIKLAAGENFAFPGAVSFNEAGHLVGWTGGQSEAKSEKCTISFHGRPLVAAGKEWSPGSGPVLFVLDDTTTAPKLMQFGPGGSGCPAAETSKPAASVLKVAVEETSPIPITSTVEFKTQVTQGDALESEWNWGDGSAPTIVKTPVHQVVEQSHKFASGGTHKVVVTIHTDDLASPTVTNETNVTITSPGPTATTGTATADGPTAETLKGAVDPNGSNTTCIFEYGETTAYGKTASCATQPGAGTSSVPVEAQVSGLKEGTTYHYTVKAENAAHETASGSDANFATGKASPPPSVVTEAATGVSNEAATLHAKIKPEGSAIIECKFEYGPTSAYGKSVACTPKPGTEEASVTGVVTGLTKGSLYHFRVVAKNAGNAETADGADATLTTTAIEAPKVLTGAASAISQTGATLNATVNAEGSSAECRFQYGTTNAYGHEAPCAPNPVTGSSAAPVSAAVSGLSAGTTYHFRVVAKNANPATTNGLDATFVTESPPVSTTTGTSTTPPPTTTGGGVKSFTFSSPIAKIAGSSITVSASGGVPLKVSCPASAGSCAGTVVLKTASAVAASAPESSLGSVLSAAVASAGRLAAGAGHAAAAHKAVLTLASGSFSVTEKQTKAITLHLSAKAKKLLAKSHTIRAKATLIARNPQGATHTTVLTLVLKAAKKK